MDWSRAAAGGLAGAVALTLLHETARRILPDAPRMDLLGMEAIARLLQEVDQTPPPPEQLHTTALAGDIASNALYYSLAGIGAPGGSVKRGVLLGLVAGIGAVVLPEPLGLDPSPSNRTLATQLMTVAWYTVGGIVAGAAMRR